MVPWVGPTLTLSRGSPTIQFMGFQGGWWQRAGQIGIVTMEIKQQCLCHQIPPSLKLASGTASGWKLRTRKSEGNSLQEAVDPAWSTALGRSVHRANKLGCVG